MYSNFKLTCDVQYTLTQWDRVKPVEVTLIQIGKQLNAFSMETMIITMFTSMPTLKRHAFSHRNRVQKHFLSTMR